MASLKELRARIGSIKSTRKITSAMKMVAAAKLRRAQASAEAARPYAAAMRRMLGELAAAVQGEGGVPRLLSGTGQDKVHLLVPLTSDRGLCGGFNSNVHRLTVQTIRRLQSEGKTVRLLPVGRRALNFFSRDYADLIVDHVSGVSGKEIPFSVASDLGEKINALVETGEIDVCALVFNKFHNAMTQVPTSQQLVPMLMEERGAGDVPADNVAQYEFEPDEATILAMLLPRNLQVQIYAALLETAAGENGARMTAMDNATRNAGRSIDSLTQVYNRTRQTNITNELIEIISGAQAV
ncbi:MAG: F0F1 ATP synthase subunit gamma [Acetobacter peroxydans]|jgi:F-type H+-transporting ATPase subunit gamma|uniref:ATP synthase gamma chain n=1 Tax=Acetobacter peroxydans TaxID=104098 RepID=A0A4Y3TU46_9PROT|nr:F0F1 ATP synthase subunit gamma [Acetobacter peroxydans]MCH4092927.1 F0F1 ATP synthase subunit gamma [Acetobacter peroxydans]MCI2008520.1 F0F1 ATP synthase subunit gamma [Acetobacter peroxydans]MCI2078271.1 F0F1 ATP synthase subunit gamma [Acetobacter peroxydans]NHO16457.1 F0F1 ATP synthase subunit gamma [Acetobacter peroxydans]GBR37151.1 ATP synthase F0F1 subunit gamma [Acetobacter peroxydans NBRC 13755]